MKWRGSDYDVNWPLVAYAATLTVLAAATCAGLMGCTSTTILAPSAPSEDCVWANGMIDGVNVEGWMCPTLLELNS